MAKKKTKNQPKKKQVNAENVIGLHSEVTDQPITQTLEVNYMPYAMSVNVSRAFPEIDGFKPSHRKLLYTMYKMGLLKGERQKSANIVGQTMKLNPHGDAAIYETMVRLATGNEALLAPFVESKGNFGKYYSGDLSYAASRYTEAKLSPISAEIFKDIDKDPVDFVDSYDGAMKEPRLLPTSFPNILVSANKGIGVAMASDICGFNLNEVCTATMHYLQDPDCDLLEYMPMPDFSTGGEIIYRREEMEKIIETASRPWSTSLSTMTGAAAMICRMPISCCWVYPARPRRRCRCIWPIRATRSPTFRWRTVWSRPSRFTRSIRCACSV